MEFIKWLQQLNWVTIGSQVLTGIAVITSMILWFRKQLSNVHSVVTSSHSLGEIYKSIKGLLLSNEGILNEISALKKENAELRKYIVMYMEREKM